MVDGDALEMRFGETQRGFESPPLRFISYQLSVISYQSRDIFGFKPYVFITVQ